MKKPILVHPHQNYPLETIHLEVTPSPPQCAATFLKRTYYKNLAIANRSRVICASNTSMVSTVTPWPWNLG